MRDVTPSSEAKIIAAVEKIKSRNDHKYGTKPQRSLALGEIAAQFFNFFHTISKKNKHSHAHLLRPNDVQTNANCIPTRWQ